MTLEGLNKSGIVPHVVGWASGAIVFPLAAYIGQAVLQTIGVAAHVRILAPVAGFVSVVAAGSLAAVTYIGAHNAVVQLDTSNKEQKIFFQPFPTMVEIVGHGVFAAYVVFLLGGKFRSFCPSSLFHLGAFAVRSKAGSIHARHEAYATLKEKKIVTRIGHTHGCHTCGRRGRIFKQKFNADHQPPKSMSKGPHRFYPQCVPCSNKQGGNLSKGGGQFTKTLVHHGTSLRKFHLWLPFSVFGSFLYTNKVLLMDSGKIWSTKKFGGGNRSNGNGGNGGGAGGGCDGASLSPRRWPGD
eukprot:m.225625 g.225625  ORF g.225625 m.225625 type:complete len:297 (+) comp33465_c2_seq1:510-1400(+)